MDRWTEAHESNRSKIVHHPDFPKLVRATAKAEPVTHRHRNAPWMMRTSRGYMSSGPGFAQLSRRAREISLRISNDVGLFPQLPDSERWAQGYGIAREYVRLRLDGTHVDEYETDRIEHHRQVYRQVMGNAEDVHNQNRVERHMFGE